MRLLYDHYAPTLYGIVLRIVQSEELAQDVLQESFIKVWRNRHRYDATKGRLFTWLLNICRNQAIDTVRSARHIQSQKIQPIDFSVYNLESLSNRPAPEHIGVQQMVETLDPKYRQVIDLIYFQGYTHTEVEEALQIPLGTVKSRVKIALRELRKFFRDHPSLLWWLFLMCIS